MVPRETLIDVFRLLADLEKAGVNNSEVARRLGKSASTIFRWKMCEAEPTYTDGCRLIEIHAYVIAHFPQTETH